MCDNVNLENPDNPQVTTEAEKELFHDGLWSGYGTPHQRHSADSRPLERKFAAAKNRIARNFVESSFNLYR